jgi:Ca-activated chloride channel family protein
MKLARLLAVAAVVAAALAAAHEVRGAGFLVPTSESIPPLAIKYLRVDTTIDNQVATTRVVQEFQNSTSQNLECTYIFPLPCGAAIRDFAMYIGGKRMKGELLERDRARQVYEEIVRRTRDPGLLEYMDGSILRLRIFPVPANGTQKVEIEYTEVIPVDNGLAEYVFPLRVGEKASKTLEDFTVAVRIRSGTKIKTVYSPTHEIGVARPSDNEAVAGLETRGALLDRDFHLFYTLSDKDFGLTLMTYRPESDKPGMFLILISPRSEVNADQRPLRDVILVLDTSGSMKGEKIEQAKKALKFCIDNLDRRDRFAIIQFSTMAQPFAQGWTDATDENRKKAREWIDQFEAAGGTNIGEALQKAFALPLQDARPATVLFITDGRPTVDITDTEALMKLVKEGNKKNLRIFTFGVGDDVNTHLLDRMANDAGGLPEYVRQGEAIDGKVTRLFAKMSHPVLTDISIDIPGVKVTETYPRQLPDLFRGAQVVVLGSYTGDGDSVIRLRGRVGEKKEEFTYEGTFPKKTTERSFIGALFAHRKIGYLLDQIRLHGESKELKDEVIRLSLAYGIETPYTSYLVLENEAQYRQYGITIQGAAQSVGGTGGPVPTTAPPSVSTAPAARPDSNGSHRAAERLQSAYGFAAPGAPAARGKSALGTGANEQPAGRPSRSPEGAAYDVAGISIDADTFAKAETGATAVDIAQKIKQLREAQGARDTRGRQAVQEKGGRRFVNYRGVWVDEKFDGSQRLVKIKWGSEAFFRLTRDRADIRDAFALGQRVVVVTARGQAVAIDADEGAETLSDADLKTLFTDSPAPTK